nr:reverse transcriptase domain-containing protein [Tanacetum cinerariifolium]
QAEFAYNRSVNRTTCKSPFEVVYGRNLNTPMDLVLIPDVGRFSEEGADQSEQIKELHRCDQQASQRNKYALRLFCGNKFLSRTGLKFGWSLENGSTDKTHCFAMCPNMTVEEVINEFDKLHMRCDVVEKEEEIVAQFLGVLKPEIADIVSLENSSS